MNKKVSFEISKLLKEKGFNEVVRTFYNLSGETVEGILPNSLTKYSSAPIIADVVVWLLEKHDIWVEVVLVSDNSTVWWNYYISSIKEGALSEDDETEFKDPIKAYEAAIDYVLKNLI